VASASSFAVARGDRRTDQPKDEREVRGERCSAGNTGVEESPQHDLRDRQDRDAQRRERGDEVFDLGGERPGSDPPSDGHCAGLAFLNASRS
jgi:hypothetical protein